MKKILKIVLNILKYLCLIIFALYLTILVVQKVSNNKATLAGYRVFTVISESMVPKYQIGDILVIKSTKAEDIKIGDDLCYLGEEADFAGKVVTHKVKEIHNNDDGSISFITEGIANVMPDPEVKSNQIYGTVIYKIISLSLIGKLLSNKIIFFLVIFIPILIIIISKVINVFNEITEDDDDDEEKEEE